MALKPGRVTIVYGRNLILSDMDKAVLVLMYPRSTPHVDAPEWTVEHALTIVGVPKQLQRDIIGDGSPDGIRDRVVEWNEAARSLYSVTV